MKVLQVFNLHRGGGGADNATFATIAALQAQGVMVERFQRDSRDLPLDLGGKLRAFGSGLYARNAVREFSRRLDASRPTLVHVHELYPLISPWVLPECSARGIPVVMSVYDYRLTCPTHNHFFEGRVCTRCIAEGETACVRQNCRGSLAESVAFAARNALARRLGLFTKHVDLFVTPTRFTADWLVREAGIASDRVATVPCAIDIPPTPVADPSKGQYIAFAGRFVAEKGAAVAIEAARLAGLPLWLAGDAAQSLDGLAVAPHLRYLVTRNREELAAFYRGARAFVMPSIWFESFGIVVGEAMSHGIPVLASRIGALAQTTLDGVTGLHFQPGDAADLARCMRHVWDDPALCRNLGRGGRDVIERTSSPRAHGLAMLGAYQTALSRVLKSAPPARA